LKLVKSAIYLFVLSALLGCDEPSKTDSSFWQYDSVEDAAVIKVALRVNPASYYWQDGLETGFDYQLM